MDHHRTLSSLGSKRYQKSQLSERSEDSVEDPSSRGVPFTRYKQQSAVNYKSDNRPTSAIQKTYISGPKGSRPEPGLGRSSKQDDLEIKHHAPSTLGRPQPGLARSISKDRDVKSILNDDRDSLDEHRDSRHYSTLETADKKRHKPKIGVNLSGTRYEVVRLACERLGFSILDEDDFASPYLIWNDSFISTERISELKSFQRINHFPGMAEICRKDMLAKNMSKMQKLHPNEFSFVPRTWCLPSDYGTFQQHAKESKRLNKKKTYIYKPANGAMGNGIRIYKNADQVPSNSENSSIVQEYLSKPFLIDGYKCDMRIYVLVTSCDPLRIYFYNDGLLRMSTEKYVNPADCQNDTLYMHLTNYSINKKSEQYEKSANDSTGSKRSIRFLNEYLQKNDYDVPLLWRNIIDLIIKTLLVAYPHILQSYRMCRPGAPPSANSVCFEVLGFDIMLDYKLKPWLLEVNRSPSFGIDQPIDRDVKLGVVSETLRLLNIRRSDKAKNMQAQKAQAQKRLLKGLNDNRANGDVVDYKGQKKKQMLNKKREELEVLLIRLKKEAQRDEYEYRSCHRFRRVFPSDDKLKHDKYADLIISIFAQFMQGRAGALQREIEMHYANKVRQEDVMEMLQQYETDGHITKKQVDGSASSDASSDEDNESMDHSSSRQSNKSLKFQRSTSLPRPKTTSVRRLSSSSVSRSQQMSPLRSGRLSAKRLVPVIARTSSIPSLLESDKISLPLGVQHETEEMTRLTLKYLNELTIKFPGKSNKAAEELLSKLQSNWKFYKPRVASYWLVKLDSGKRKKVIDIVQQNVKIILQKSYHTIDINKLRLFRLFNKVFNRLLWSNGQGLWTTFSSSGNWEIIFSQSTETVSSGEMNCCRRVVQLCQDCLMTVYLFSTNGLTDTTATVSAVDTSSFTHSHLPLTLTRA